VKCKKYSDQVILFAYGELDDSREFEAHAAQCPACIAEVAQYRAISAAVRAMPEAPAPSLRSDRLRQAILSRELQHKPKWLLQWGALGAAAAAVFAVWLVANRGLGGAQPRPMPDTDAPIANLTPDPDIPNIELPVKPVDKSAVGLPEARQTKASAKKVGRRVARTQKSPVPAPQLDELLAVASNGVSGAMDAASTTTRTETAPAVMAPDKREAEGVIVIRPGDSGASEKSLKDVSIGG
jgi:hypothetical protein